MTRLVVGIQPVREALRAHGARVERLLVLRGDHPRLEALARHAADQGVEVERVARAELDRRAGGTVHQGAIALAPDLARVALDELSLDDTTLLLALDGVQDPQNFGAALRSAVALGATAILWPEHASAPLSPATFRASAGAVEHAVLCRVPSLPDALRRLAARGVTVVGLDDGAPRLLHELDLSGGVALVIGSEERGLRRPTRGACHHLARLPTPGPVRSLNASVAAALALYEVRRRRG